MHKTVLQMGVLDVQGKMLTQTMEKGRAVSPAQMSTSLNNDASPFASFSRIYFYKSAC